MGYGDISSSARASPSLPESIGSLKQLWIPLTCHQSIGIRTFPHSNAHNVGRTRHLQVFPVWPIAACRWTNHIYQRGRHPSVVCGAPQRPPTSAGCGLISGWCLACMCHSRSLMVWSEAVELFKSSQSCQLGNYGMLSAIIQLSRVKLSLQYCASWYKPRVSYTV